MTSIFHFLSRASLLLCAAASAAALSETVNPNRLWLPPSSAHLQPHLEHAARLALQHEDCQEVLYGRLNEYRTQREEPSLTILCQKDHRSTFNLVYLLAELEQLIEPDPEQLQVRADENRAAEGIEALRRQLIREQQSPSPVGGHNRPAVQRQGQAQNADAEDEAELDLDRERRTSGRSASRTARDEAPELF